jgi:hypothetical protein
MGFRIKELPRERHFDYRPLRQGSLRQAPFGRLPSAGSGHRRASQGIAGHRIDHFGHWVLKVKRAKAKAKAKSKFTGSRVHGFMGLRVYGFLRTPDP